MKDLDEKTKKMDIDWDTTLAVVLIVAMIFVGVMYLSSEWLSIISK